MRRLRFAVPAILFTLFLAPSVYAAPVNVNEADPDTLASSLRGVGPKTAAEIVRHREEHGAFESVDQLLEVKGIGEKTLERIREDMLLDSERGSDSETQ